MPERSSTSSTLNEATPPVVDGADQGDRAAGNDPGAPRLTQRTVAGLGWSGIGVVGTVVLRVVVLAVLARLVAPEEFGLVAAALLAVELSTLVADLGLGAALVQSPDLDDDDVRVGFTSGLLTALVAFAALVAGAGLVEAAMDIDELAPVVQVIAVTFVIRSLTLGDFLLARRLRFRTLSMVELGSFAIGHGVVAIVLATQGYGAWAIVYGHVGLACVRTVALWITCPHPMRPLLRWSIVKRLAAYGGGHTLARLANWIARQGDYFVVGRMLGAAALGLYSRAYQLMTLPAELFGRAVNDVLFPAMASVQDRPARLRRAYLTGARALALATMPLSLMGAALSHETILLILGPDWTEVGPAFSVMAFGVFFRTATKLSDALVRATGAVYRRAWRQAVYAALVIGGALAGFQVGIIGVAVGVLAALVVNFLLMADLSLRLTGTGWSTLARAHVPGLMLAGVAGAATWGTAVGMRAWGAGPIPVWFVGVGVGSLSGLLLIRLAPHMRVTAALGSAMHELSSLMPGRLRRVAARLTGAGERGRG